MDRLSWPPISSSNRLDSDMDSKDVTLLVELSYVSDWNVESSIAYYVTSTEIGKYWILRRKHIRRAGCMPSVMNDASNTAWCEIPPPEIKGFTHIRFYCRDACLVRKGRMQLYTELVEDRRPQLELKTHYEWKRTRSTKSHQNRQFVMRRMLWYAYASKVVRTRKRQYWYTFHNSIAAYDTISFKNAQ